MRVVGQEQATNVPAWHVEANRTLDVARILSEKSGLRREAVERSAVAVRAGEVTSSPSGRPLLSTSARDVLQQAAAVAAEKHGPQAAVMPADIMASYLYTIPPAHQRQAERWGLNGTAIQRIGVLLSGAQNVEPRPGELPGYDMAASSVLKSAFVLPGGGGVRTSYCLPPKRCWSH